MNTKIIKFDINKNLYDTLIAKQGDTKSRFLLFNLLDGSIPFSLENRSVRVYAIKPDGTEVFNDLIITDAAKGYCILELTTQMLAVAGTVKLELMVIEGEKKLTSNIFYMDVKKSINSEKAVVSTNEFGTLLTALASLDEYDNYKNEIKNARGGQVNLKTRLDNFGEQLDKKAEQVDLEIERSRIDNLINQGNGVDNAETVDIRVGANGEIYSSAGNSVRTQIKDVYDNIENGVSKGYKRNYSNSSTFEIGGINANGEQFSNERYIRTKSYINTNIEKINVLDANYVFMLIRYSNTGTFVDRFTSLTTFDEFDYSNYKYKIVLYHVDNTTTIDASYYDKISFLSENLEFLNSIDEFIKPNVITPAKTTFLKPSKNLLIGELVENHYISWLDGTLVENDKYNTLTNICVKGNITLSLNRHNSLAFYDEQGKYIGGINGVGTKGNNYIINEGDIEGQNMHGKYVVPSNTAYMSLTIDKKYSDQQLEYGEESTEYVKPCVYIENFYYPDAETPSTPSFAKNKFVKSSDICTITTPKAKYTFKKVTDTGINVDTWRLYEGKLIATDGAEYTMWINSDAEGAIKLKDEEDFVCGYHGDEICTDIHIIVDGITLDMTQNYDVYFDNLTIIVNSDVYHCNTSINKGIKAFERVKTLNFSGNKVSIANRFVCAKSITVTRGSLMLFQCYKTQGETKILNSFWNNNDLKYWDVPSATGSMPSANKNMTQAKFFTNVGVIDFKATRGIENEYYLGAIANFSDQNRLKIYFDYIDESFGEVNYNLNDVFLTEFEFTIS